MMGFTDYLTDEGGQLCLDPPAGVSVHDCLEACCAWAREKKRPVTLRNFNGVDVVCGPKDSAAACYVYWEREMDRAAEAYRNSPEGKRAAAEAKARAAACQVMTSRLLEAVPAGLEKLVPWLAELSMHADHVDVCWDMAALLSQLKALGFIANAHVGRAGAWNRKKLGEYIVGQAMDCLSRGMPPHPVTQKFAEEWAAMPP